MGKICDAHGGPRQYLQATYLDRPSRAAFAASILKLVPFADTVKYHTSQIVPEIAETDKSKADFQILHLSSFSFTNKGSLKTPPGKSITLQLADHYLSEGFITSGDPVYITQPQGIDSFPAPWCRCETEELNGQMIKKYLPENQLESQSIGYSKGQARVMTLLAILSILTRDDITKEIVTQATRNV